ncbi:MAG: ATP-binding cassette domain-containing protein [Chitinophagaceae bacterium]|nr:ATP-binding cassette domain-containing protein [Chitinophagaceae bacterium]
MEILRIENVKKYFTSQKAVDDISLSVHQGSIFGLLGPNGAGKTTLIRMITGIFFPDEGRIFFDGRKFNVREDVKKIGYMPEERGLYKKMKIGEQALYLARLKGLSRSEALNKTKKWFEKFEMQSWWNKKVEDLSKGMSQKLQFVTTVLHEPKLIILDEPFSGLDPVNTNLIKDEIFRLAHEGATVIFSTHRMEQVEEICDHIILVNKGKKILDGNVQEIKKQFKENLFSVGVDRPFSDASDYLPFRIMGQKNGKQVIQILDGKTPNDVLQYLIQRGFEIHSFQELLPSLNDIFIKLVEGTSPSRAFEQLN